MTNPDPFKRAEDEYFRLKGQLATGRITRAQFDSALKALMVQDAQGSYWMLGAEDGKWYVNNGAQWVQAAPPGVPTLPPAHLPERGAQAIAPKTSAARKTNYVPFLLLGALVVLGLGAAAFVLYLNRPASPQVALPPTSVPTVAPAATAQVAMVTEMPAPSASVLPTALAPTETPTAAPIVSNAPGVQVMLLPNASPVPITAKDFAAHNAALAEKIAALNAAELKLIRDLRASAFNGRPGGFAFPAPQTISPVIDQDLKDAAAKAMDVAILAGELGEMAARQDQGSAQTAQSAEAYTNIARSAFALVLDAQNVRAQLDSNQIANTQASELVAQYGAQLWNSEITQGGTEGNPFDALLKNTEPSQTLNAVTAASVQAALGAGPGSIWIAQSGTQTTKTVTVPAAQAPVTNPFDPQTLQALTTAEGQSDANKAQQVAAVNLSRLGAQSLSADSSKPIQMQVPINPVAVAEGGQIKSGDLPTFPAGKAVVVAQNSGNDDPFLQSFGLNGQQPPTDEGKTQVQDAQPLINLTITNIVINSVNKFAKGSSSFDADVQYEFTVSWNTNLKSPQFELECTSGNHFGITTASGSQQVKAKGLLILYPGAEDAYCYASHNGSTWGSASVRFLVGDAAGATARAIQVETDSEILNRTLTADAQGTASAGQTNEAATVQVLATQHALETEVAGTETVEFKQTADAFGTKQAQPPPDTATPSATPTFTPKVVDQVSHPGNIFAVNTNVVLERGHLYRFTFTGQVNLINPTRSVSASDLPEHVNGITVPASGIVVVEGTGSVATISCGSGEPDPNDPGAFGITVEDLGPM